MTGELGDTKPLGVLKKKRATAQYENSIGMKGNLRSNTS